VDKWSLLLANNDDPTLDDLIKYRKATKSWTPTEEDRAVIRSNPIISTQPEKPPSPVDWRKVKDLPPHLIEMLEREEEKKKIELEENLRLKKWLNA
jgi:hypothetical protein